MGKRVLWISFALLFAQLVGSAFNIWYNLSHIRPLLEPVQLKKFAATILYYNGIIYPIGLAAWLAIVLSIARAWKDGDRESDAWRRATRRMINLPWLAIIICGAAWLSTIPVLMWAANSTPVPLDPQVNLHLPVSIVIAALIAMAQGFFVVEILTQRLLYPLFLTDAKSAPGWARTTSIGRFCRR